MQMPIMVNFTALLQNSTWRGELPHKGMLVILRRACPPAMRTAIETVRERS